MLLRVGQDQTNAAVPFGYYLEDDNACVRRRVRSRTSRWAEREMWSAGGPGSGYEAMSIVLAQGKTLDDLAAWMERRTARARKRRVTSPLPAFPSLGPP
jgi:hypothetical protein